jgi:prevent-host-death family protein
MAIVTSAEVQKNFGRYREQALAGPVIVTQYGKPSVVIISAAEYERLKELDRRVMRLDNMSDTEIEEMLDSSVPLEQRYSISEIEE